MHGSALLPRPHLSGDDAEKWMWLGRLDLLHFAIQLRSPGAQFQPQVLPFVKQLPTRLLQLRQTGRQPDFPLVESITATRGFLGDGGQVGSHQRKRFGVLAKSRELRVASVSPRFTGDDLLGEESFAPKRHQSPGVQVSWMNGPKAHGNRNAIVFNELRQLTKRALV